MNVHTYMMYAYIFISDIAGSDYVIVDILLEFTTSTRMCGQISIINDELVESDEQFNLTISVTPPISGAVIGNDGMATVTIMDSDG